MRETVRISTCAALAALLAACASPSVEPMQKAQTRLPDPVQTATVAAPAPALPKPLQVEGEVIGTGTVRVAMLLPKSAPGNGGAIALEYRNAAELAMQDFGLDTLQLVIKDTRGTPADAQAAAEQAVAEQADIVLGPLFSGSVSAASGALLPARKPMIAFSSDRNVAGSGVYLLSFLPESVIDRTAAYALSQGHRSVAAIVPQGAYGELVERQLRETLGRDGGTLTGIARYAYDDASVAKAAEEIAAAAGLASAIYIPDGGKTPRAVVEALRKAGVNLAGKVMLGTGQWTGSDLSDPAFQGALYADLDQSGFGVFKERYTRTFGKAPTVNAGIGYDAVALVAGIVRRSGSYGLNPVTLQAPLGFTGTTGAFRFRYDGTTERGLTIYRVGLTGIEIASPAPRNFGGPES